jgi:hypothetical protein
MTARLVKRARAKENTQKNVCGITGGIRQLYAPRVRWESNKIPSNTHL